MEALFRFNIVRDARRSADEVDPIDLGTGSAFQQSAAAIPAGPKRREELKTLAGTFIASPDFVSAVSADPDLERLDRSRGRGFVPGLHSCDVGITELYALSDVAVAEASASRSTGVDFY